MTRYSIAEARESLPRLIDKALAGEDVMLTRDGVAVAELRASQRRAAPRPLSEAEWRRLRARRAARPSLGEDSVTIVRAMRDRES
jgi:antitoxin (DNA-binding transcriptional repressor) of toxin-antitoxin stability system